MCITPNICRRPRARRATVRPRLCCAVFMTVGVFNALSIDTVDAATVESSNFRVTASDARIAEELAAAAEQLRTQIAREWLGEELPQWTSRCHVVVDTDTERMRGDTTYQFGGGRVSRWRMTLRGPLERIVESLLPHEITHTVLASHFQRAIPRWADEGVALMAEDELDRRRVRAMADSFLASGVQHSLQSLLQFDEYPADRQRMRILYAQSASFTEFLVMAGKQRLLQFVAAGIKDGWEVAAESAYGFTSLAEAEQSWLKWEAHGRPLYVIREASLLSDAVRSNSAAATTSVTPIREDSASDAATMSIRRAASMPDPAPAGAR